MPGILDRQIVQTEFLLHFIEFSAGGVQQSNPYKTIGPLDIFADIRGGYVSKLDPVFIGNTIDQHDDFLWFSLPWQSPISPGIMAPSHPHSSDTTYDISITAVLVK